MILLRSAGPAVFGTPQIASAQTDLLQGAADFVSLFERAMGISMMTPMTDAVIPDRPIGTVVNPEGEEGVVTAQLSSGEHDNKVPAGLDIDPAAALLAAVLGLPTEAQQALRVATLPADVEAMTADGAGGMPMGMTVWSQSFNPRPVIASDQRERGNLTVVAQNDCGIASVAPLPRNDAAGDFRGNDGDAGELPSDARYAGTTPIGPQVRIPSPQSSSPIPWEPVLEPAVHQMTTASTRPVRFADERATRPEAAIPQEGTMSGVAQEPVSPSPDPQPSAVNTSGDRSEAVPRPLHLPQGSTRTSVAADPETGVSRTHSGSTDMQIDGETAPDANVIAGDQRERRHLTLIDAAKNGAIASATPRNDTEGFLTHDRSQSDVQSDGSHSVRRASLPTAAVREVQDGVSRSVVDRTTDQTIDPVRSAAVMEGRAEGEGAASGRIPERRSPWQRSTEGIETFSDQPQLRRPDQLEGEDIRRYMRVERADSHRAVVRQGTASFGDTPDRRQERPVSDGTDGCRPVDRTAPSFDDGRQTRVDLPGIAALQEEQAQSGPAAPSVRPRALVDQVAEQIVTIARIGRRNEGSHVQLRLYPQTLGEVVVEVSWKDIGIVAAIKAENHVAGELLAHDLDRLRHALGEQGIPVAGLDVQVGVDLRQWNHAGNGLHAAPGPEYPPAAMPWHDPRPMLSVIPAMDPDRLIDIRV